MEKEPEAQEGQLIFEKVSGLSEVMEKIKDFTPNDRVILDFDETCAPSLENYLCGKSFHVLDEEVENFLKYFEEKNVPLAIITNRPRENHSLEKRVKVMGYEYYTNKEYLKTPEYFLTMVILASWYKETQHCHYNVANWLVNGHDSDLERIAWIGNSILDKSFGKNLYRVLQDDFDFKNNLTTYKVPFKSFKDKQISDILKQCLKRNQNTI